MAEASSSGRESSEEDEQDEEFPSHCVSSIIAGTRPPQTKKPRYVQDKPALTEDNICTIFSGIDWKTINKHILNLPESKCDEIAEQFSSDDDRVRAGIREWLLCDPIASWRRLIDRLYLVDETERADSIAHYAEELTDTKHTYTYPNLSNVLKLVEYVGITDCLGIPYSVRRKIKERSKNKEQQRYECICYWRNVAPYSIIGWGFLGGMLHFYGQKTALSAANKFIQRAPEPTLTVNNLTRVFESMQRGMTFPSHSFHIPHYVRDELRRLCDKRLVESPYAYADYFISHHPAPSWNIVANALWLLRETEALEMVEKLRYKDINLQSLCLAKLSSWLKSDGDFDSLPLPVKLKEELKHYRVTEVPAEIQITFNSFMSKDDFYKWLRLRGVSEKDCKTLSEKGVTPLEFCMYDDDYFDDIGLTELGKTLVQKIWAEVS